MVRLKHRYLVLNLLYPSPTPSTTLLTTPSSLLSPLLTLHAPTPPSFDARALLALLRTTLFTLFGDLGAGPVSASLAVKYFSGATSTAIVRCRREGWRLVWAACCFVRGIGGKRGEREREVVVRVVRVSGTVRKCEEEVVRRARGLMGRVAGVGGGAGLFGRGGAGTGVEDPARGLDGDEGMSDGLGGDAEEEEEDG